MIKQLATKSLFHFLARPSKKITQTPTSSYCIYKADSIGDFILALSAIRILTQHWGEGQTTLIINPALKELAEREFPECNIQPIKPFAPKARDCISAFLTSRPSVGTTHFDTTVSLRHQRNNYQQLLLSWINSRSATVIKSESPNDVSIFPREGWAEIDPKDTLSTSPRLCRELELHRLLLQVALDRAVSESEILPRLNNFSVENGDEILISPIGTDPLRSVPYSIISSTLSALEPRAPSRKAVCIGSPSQISELKTFSERLRHECGWDIETTITPSLIDFVSRIAKCRAIITTETSSTHIAGALDKPSFTFIGGGHYGLFAPWKQSQRQTWIGNHLPCYGCDWNCGFEEPYCITNIRPLDIKHCVERWPLDN